MTLRFLTAGESHGPAMLAILEGLPSGLALSEEMINAQLQRRQAGYGSGPRMKLEKDQVNILSGVMEGLTLGSPLALSIANLNHAQWRDKAVEAFTIPRPGHADLAGAVKYGYRDLRPVLERASARETVARVAAGAVCMQLLSHFAIQTGGYVCSIGEIESNLAEISLEKRLELAGQSDVRCPHEASAAAMRARIDRAIEEKDTLGGVIEIVVLGLPAGLGSYVHWDRRLDARLGAAVLGVQAMKGVEIGPAFENARLPGSEVQDAICLENQRLVRVGGRSGGIEGGMTTAQPLVIRAAMKPIATTLTPQHSVDLFTGEETLMKYERSDFCPVPRAVPVLESVVALVIADALLEKLGGDSLDELLNRYQQLRQMKLSDLSMDGGEHVFWPKKAGIIL